MALIHSPIYCWCLFAPAGRDHLELESMSATFTFFFEHQTPLWSAHHTYLSTIEPIGSKESYQRDVLVPLPTSCIIYLIANSLTCKSFLKIQLPLFGLWWNTPTNKMLIKKRSIVCKIPIIYIRTFCSQNPDMLQHSSFIPLHQWSPKPPYFLKLKGQQISKQHSLCS